MNVLARTIPRRRAAVRLAALPPSPSSPVPVDRRPPLQPIPRLSPFHPLPRARHPPCTPSPHGGPETAGPPAVGELR